MKYNNNIFNRSIWEVDIDLVSDMQSMSYDRMVAAGYKNVDKDRAVYQYYNIKKRALNRTRRKVHKSKEFKCPQLYALALDEFISKAEKGESLIPFLSDKLMDASYSDGMLNDWGIYHFHLTRQFKPNGWAKRSDYEIFAYVTDTDIYLLQVYEHKDPLLYCRRELVGIIYDNWPELLEKFHLKEVSGLSEKYDDEQYMKLREANISTFVELGENKVFGMIGGGYMSDGSFGEALRAADFWHNRLKEIEELFVENIDMLCGLIGQVSVCESKEYIVKLLWIENEYEFTFCEMNHHVVIQLNLIERYWRVCKPFELFGFKKY